MFKILKAAKLAKTYVQNVVALILLTIAAVFIALTQLATGKNLFEGLKLPADYDLVALVLG